MDRNKRNDNSLIPSMIFFKALNNDHYLKQRFVAMFKKSFLTISRLSYSHYSTIHFLNSLIIYELLVYGPRQISLIIFCNI